MTTQENERADAADKDKAEDSSDAEASTNDSQAADEKPEPDEKDKEAAAEMMTAYQDRPTLVLPGTGGAVSGTAVNDWLDDDGNPSALGDDDAPAAKADLSGDDSSDGGESAAKDESADEDESSGEKLSVEERIEKDKEFNRAIIEQKESEEGVSEEEKAQSEREEKSVTR